MYVFNIQLVWLSQVRQERGASFERGGRCIDTILPFFGDPTGSHLIYTTFDTLLDFIQIPVPLKNN